MPLSIKYENKAFPKGEPLEVHGILLENGKTKELSESEEIKLIRNVGGKPSESLKDNEQMTVTGSMTAKVGDVIPKDVSTVASATDHPNAPNSERGEQ